MVKLKNPWQKTWQKTWQNLKNFTRNSALNLYKNNNFIAIIIVLLIISIASLNITSLEINSLAQNIEKNYGIKSGAKNSDNKANNIALNSAEKPDYQKYNSNFENYNQKITILDDNNNSIIKLSVAIADSPEKQRYGLMNLEKLPANLGMLFIWQQPRQISMWMKSTKISLDMIFFDKNFRINHIAKKTQPHSLDIINSPPQSIAVLEVNAGTADKFNIKKGHQLSMVK